MTGQTTISRMTVTSDTPILDVEALERTCPNCDTRMHAQSCKLKCPKCGYFKSCSEF